jgi:hypothetical protein
MFVARRVSGQPPQHAYRHFAFLAFRWETGSAVARFVQSELHALGMQTFFDVKVIRADRFEESMLREIQHSANFIPILGRGALDPCRDPGDRFRREIAHAIRTERNVVPITTPDFHFPSEPLPADLAELPRYNCVSYEPRYLDATLAKLLAFCSITQPSGQSPPR